MGKVSILILFIAMGLFWSSCTSSKQGAKVKEGSFMDSRDGEVYKTVKIGNQLWMSENMRYAMEGSYLNPDNPTKSYGRLYTWEQALRVCPEGWHLPSDEEWKILEHFLGMPDEQVNTIWWRGNIGGKLKSLSGWDDYKGNVGNGDNSSGFSALPAGYFWSGSFMYLGNSAFFWSSTKKSEGFAWYRDLDSSGGAVGREGKEQQLFGYSCRCIKDGLGVVK